MRVLLWVLQVVLALHTAMGAAWKLSNSEQQVPSLAALPHAVWVGLGVVEVACALALLAPVVRRPWLRWVPLAAGLIAAEMVLFGAVHLASGVAAHGELVYWLVVAALCGALAAGRWPRGAPPA